MIAERFGKAVRSPARDTMLAQAGVSLGRGRAFALHEALDQSGALLGPLLVAGTVALSGYRLGFAVLALPGLLALAALFRLRAAAPEPAAHDHLEPHHGTKAAAETTDLHRTRFLRPLLALLRLHRALDGRLCNLRRPRLPPPGQASGQPRADPRHYALAMAAAALAALISGRLYDRFGLRALVIAPPLAAAVPFLSLSTTPRSRGQAHSAGARRWAYTNQPCAPPSPNPARARASVLRPATTSATTSTAQTTTSAPTALRNHPHQLTRRP